MDVYRALWRRGYMIVILTALVTVAAYYFSASEKKTYKASTLIRIQQKATDPGQAYSSLAVGQQLAKTYAVIVSSRAIKERVRTALGDQLPDDEVRIGGAPIQDLALLRIFATSHDPRAAAAVASVTPSVLRKFISESQTINDQIVTISPASVPSSPISPRPGHTAVLAFLLGLIFNGGLALMIEFLRDRLPDIEEIERVFGKPVLGTIPVLAFTSATAARRDSKFERVEKAQSVSSAAGGVDVLRRPRQRRRGVEGVG